MSQIEVPGQRSDLWERVGDIARRVGRLEAVPPGSGIEFDLYPQAGGYLYTETTDAGLSPNGFGTEIVDSSDGGIKIHETGGSGDVEIATGAGTSVKAKSDNNGNPGAGVDVQAATTTIKLPATTAGSGFFVLDAGSNPLLYLDTFAGVSALLQGAAGVQVQAIGGFDGVQAFVGAGGTFGAYDNSSNPIIQAVDGQLIGFYNGTAPVVQPAAIPAPAGGLVIDAQARAAIASILNALGAGTGGIGITA